MIFTGLVEDVAARYPALDVFVLSSLTEQMPMSLLEAMACGLPAISTDVGGLRGGARNPGAPAIVPSGDVAAYAESIRRFGGRPGCGSRRGRETGALCVAFFSRSYGAGIRGPVPQRRRERLSRPVTPVINSYRC